MVNHREVATNALTLLKRYDAALRRAKSCILTGSDTAAVLREINQVLDGDAARRMNMSEIEPENSVSVPDHIVRASAVARITPMDMLAEAMRNPAFRPEVLDKLMDWQERYERTQARKAFDEAMAEAKAEIPVIRKNRRVDFVSGKGRTSYNYEDLGEIVETVTPILAKHGLSFRFRTTVESNQPIIVTCIISHRQGHFEENSLPGPRDESGNKNAIQQIGSTLSYLQRYTLKASLGLAAAEDDDGVGSSAAAAIPISNEDMEKVLALIAETGTDIEVFLRHFGVDAVANLTTGALPRALGMLEQKKKRMADAAS